MSSTPIHIGKSVFCDHPDRAKPELRPNLRVESVLLARDRHAGLALVFAVTNNQRDNHQRSPRAIHKQAVVAS